MSIRWRIAVSLISLGVLFLLLPLEELAGALVRISFGVWIAVVTIFLVTHAVGAMKWRLVLRTSRASLRVGSALQCYAAGLFANLCLPSIVGGDVLRAVLAGRESGKPEAVVLGGVADRLIDVTALGGLLVLGTTVALPQLLLGATLEVVGLMGFGLLLTLVLGWGVAHRPLRRWSPRLRRPVGRTLVAGRHLVRRPAVAGIALLVSLGMQTVFVLVNAWLGYSVGIDVGLATWFFAWPMAKLAGLLPISLGGLGVRDATLGVLLGSFGVPIATGVIASLLWQTVLIAGGLIAGATWWGVAGADGRQAITHVRPVRRRRHYA